MSRVFTTGSGMDAVTCHGAYRKSEASISAYKDDLHDPEQASTHQPRQSLPDHGSEKSAPPPTKGKGCTRLTPSIELRGSEDVCRVAYKIRDRNISPLTLLSESVLQLEIIRDLRVHAPQGAHALLGAEMRPARTSQPGGYSVWWEYGQVCSHLCECEHLERSHDVG